MPDLSLVILYVDSPTASAAFYADLLGRAPAEQSPTFAMFPLPSASASAVVPSHRRTCRGGPGRGAEIAFVAPDVDAIHADWVERGLKIAQPPTELDFGRTFVALDPDGHRLPGVRALVGITGAACCDDAQRFELATSSAEIPMFGQHLRRMLGEPRGLPAGAARGAGHLDRRADPR